MNNCTGNDALGNGSSYGREQAWQLLTEWTQSESLRKHALGVEACVTACGEAEAGRLGLEGEARRAFIELYATTALLHDFDYERHPTAEEHPFVGVRELERLAGAKNCVPPFWATRSTAVCRALRIWRNPCLPATSCRGF